MEFVVTKMKKIFIILFNILNFLMHGEEDYSSFSSVPNYVIRASFDRKCEPQNLFETVNNVFL